MERMTSPGGELHACNRRLREILQVISDPAAGILGPQLANFDQITRELEKASGCISRKAWPPDPGLERERREYRTVLELLRNALMNLQGRLLAERVRLERERDHLRAVSVWTEASRNVIASR